MNDSPNKTPNDDEAFVSEIYQKMAHTLPPKTIEDAILAMAKKQVHTGPTAQENTRQKGHLSSKTLPWWKKVQYQGTVAASVAIVCLIYILQAPTSTTNIQAPPVIAKIENTTLLQAESYSPAPTAGPESLSLVQSDASEQRRKTGRYQLEEAQAKAEVEKLEINASRAMAALAQKQKESQIMSAKNEKILAQLMAIQSELNLTHSQILERPVNVETSDNSNGKASDNVLLNRYIDQQKELLANLLKIQASSADFILPSRFLKVLSKDEIDAFKRDESH